MRKTPLFFYFSIFFLGLLFLFHPWPSAAQKKPVYVIEIHEAITPATAGFIQRAIDRASRDGAQCLVIQLDTPGGLDTSMRDIVKEILNADLPVVIYVAPSGARAASAGVFITLAADIAAMAPGTNMGAAHPVAAGGRQMDRRMREKVVSDAVAYIQSIAGKKGRNMEWAARAVRENVSISDREALRKKIIDLVAKDLDDLLAKIHGRSVEKPRGTFKLDTRGLKAQAVEMGFRERVLAVLSNPNIAYLLLMIGLAGLYFELSNPGALFPGIVGGICLLLAFFAFRMLPVNYAGVMLILLGISLLLAEIKVTSYGLLTAGGLVSLTLGSIMLFESPIPALRVSLSVLIPTILFSAGFFILAVTLALKAQMAKPATGYEGLIGEIGVARTRLDPEGKVFIHGELWNADSDETIEEGEKVHVLKTDRLKLRVEKLK
jgi:membrane-bound serine protease (ClpP class)